MVPLAVGPAHTLLLSSTPPGCSLPPMDSLPPPPLPLVVVVVTTHCPRHPSHLLASLPLFITTHCPATPPARAAPPCCAQTAPGNRAIRSAARRRRATKRRRRTMCRCARSRLGERDRRKKSVYQGDAKTGMVRPLFPLCLETLLKNKMSLILEPDLFCVLFW